MSSREQYAPGPVRAEIDKSTETWTLVLVREFHHAPEKVWEALTDPEQLREWCPFDADANLGVAGATVNLTTVGAPAPHVSEAKVTRAEAPKALEYNWGNFNIRWQLEPFGDGTRLTLWANIDRRFMAMGAAGWHICLDVLDRHLDGDPMGRVCGMSAMQFEPWQRLNADYSKQFGIEAPSWS